MSLPRGWIPQPHREVIVRAWIANLRTACINRGAVWTAEIEAALTAQLTDSFDGRKRRHRKV